MKTWPTYKKIVNLPVRRYLVVNIDIGFKNVKSVGPYTRVP